jgi:hypothetical protein
MKIAYLLIILLLLSCNKEKTFEFPKGVWELNQVTYAVDGYAYNTNGSGIGSTKINSQIEGKSCVLNFNGKNRLVFIANGKKDTFKIKKFKQIKDSIFYHSSQKNLNGFNSFELTLSNNMKHYIFMYTLINDSTLVGEYWEKGQKCYRYDAPDVQEVIYNYNTIPAQSKVLYVKEILGVYHLQK